MSFSLIGRSFLKLEDFTPDEIFGLLDLAESLKLERLERREEHRLAGRNLALIFEKTSTRTRASFEVAAYDQGARVSNIDPGSSQMGQKETVRDTARVLGRLYDGIAFRGKNQNDVEALADTSGVPVYNGLTDQFHPTQILADALTMMEHSGGDLRGISCCYLGDARFNIGNSLLMGAAKIGLDFRIAAPESYWPASAHRSCCEAIATDTGAKLTFTETVEAAVDGADFLYTDIWVSMGEIDGAWADRVGHLLPYRVTADVMAMTGKPDTRFLHCLPSYHDLGTDIGRKIADRFDLDGIEVSDDVFESAASVVFDQAENRLHTIKAVLVATLC